MKKLFLVSLLIFSVVPTTSKGIDWPVDITTGEVVSFIGAPCLAYFSCLPPFDGVYGDSYGYGLCMGVSIAGLWGLGANAARIERIQEKRLRNKELVRPLEDIITKEFISDLARIKSITRDYELYLKGEKTLESMIQAQGFASNYAYPLTEYVNALPTPYSLKPTNSLQLTLGKLQYRLKYLQQEIEAAVPGRSKHDVSVISLEDVQKQIVVVENYINLISQLQNVLAECKSTLLKTDRYTHECDQKDRAELQNALGKVNDQFENVMA